MEKKNNKKHKFNAIDAAIIIAVAAIIGAAIFLFSTGNVVEPVKTTNIEYVIELRTVRNEFKDNFEIGQQVVDSVAKYHLGHIVSFSSVDATFNGNDMQTGSLVNGIYPDHSDIRLTVSAEAVPGAYGRYVIDGGYDISVGSTIYVRLPDYTGVGYCVQLWETEVK